MKNMRYISIEQDIWDTEYTLTYKFNKKTGKEYAILACPYTKWTSTSMATLDFRYYKIEDEKVLECIEREFFDEDRFKIPVADYGYVYIDAIADKTFAGLPKEVYQSVIDGTYELPYDYTLMDNN